MVFYLLIYLLMSRRLIMMSPDLPHWSLRDRPRRRVSAVAARRHHRALSRVRLRGGLEIRSGGIWTSRTCFSAPVLTFGTDVNLPLTFTYVPMSGRRPQVGHLPI
jgi:hypothetical protein